MSTEFPNSQEGHDNLSVESILREHDRTVDRFRRFTDEVFTLVQKLIGQSGIVVADFAKRVKDRSRLEEKLRQKGDAYACLDDVTDIAGVRIITLFHDDVDRVAQIITKEFDN